MANLRVGESGKRLRFATSFDMSANTALAFDFTKGDGSLQTVAATLEGGAIVMDLNGTATNILASESCFYDFEPGDLSANSDGPWSVDLTYTNTSTSPDDVFKALATFTVDP